MLEIKTVIELFEIRKNNRLINRGKATSWFNQINAGLVNTLLVVEQTLDRT